MIFKILHFRIFTGLDKMYNMERCFATYIISKERCLYSKRNDPRKLSVTSGNSTVKTRKCHKYSISDDISDGGRLSKDRSTFTTRSHTCGELDLENIGERVTLYGWLEYHRMNKFLTLRDAYGSTQIIMPIHKSEEVISLDRVPYESILKVIGTVQARPKDMVNVNQSTGKIEVVLESIEIINEVKEKLPFNIRNHNRAKEHIRLQHRYLDLRFPQMQHNLRLRSEMLMHMREILIKKHSFVEVETPTLFNRTPGGAQEFIVPTRNYGEFYSLVQSPQQLKQMLMAGAIDRYFQFARCYRDEGSRPDRQPEFTQLDIELSYPHANGILELIEDLLYNSWPKDKGTIKLPFERMTYDEAMFRYGTDKPDVRFGLELIDLSKTILESTNIQQNHADFGCYMIKAPQSYAVLTNPIKKQLSKFAEKYSDVKFVQSAVNANCVADWCSSKFGMLFTEGVLKSIAINHNLEPNDVIFLAYGDKTRVQTLMGKIRVLYKDLLEIHGIQIPKTKKDEWNFLWITDFPLFTLESGDKSDVKILTSTHHPFTAPHIDDLNKLTSHPIKVRSQAYDLVLNGVEIGGGSTRIHDADLQRRIFSEFLKIDYSHLKSLLKALSSGCPPHGGIALGVDRLIAIICNASSIRDVIAFPKSVDGRDPLSGAPTPISNEEKMLYHIANIKT